jgi:glycyl-tRNA synthetase beta subunit
MKDFPFDSVTERRDVSFNQTYERSSNVYDSHTLANRTTEFLEKCWPGQPIQPQVRVLRFLEEALELAQSMGITKEKALEQVDYTFSRPVGEPTQEFGGTVFTLTNVGVALGLDLITEGHRSVDEATARIEQIRAKSKTKPHV